MVKLGCLILTGRLNNQLKAGVLCHSENNGANFVSCDIQPRKKDIVYTWLHNQGIPCDLHLITYQRQPATMACTGVPLFLGVQIDSRWWFLRFNEQLTFVDQPVDEHCIYIEVPYGKQLCANQTTDYLKVNGRPLVEYLKSNLEELNISCAPLVNNLPNSRSQDIIINQSCTPNCEGKDCGADNGCGLPCMCPSGQRCQNGKCVDIPCSDKGPCRGKCSGVCPKGYTCAKDNQGMHYCRSSSNNAWTIGLGIILIILLILVIIIFWLWMFKGWTPTRGPSTVNQSGYNYS